MVTAPKADGRRLRGDASRRAVLASASQLASVSGLDGLSIGALAAHSGRSKSSVSSLFGSKEALQLATVASAREVFLSAVITPAREHPRGFPRLAALLERQLAYSRDRVFAGGCFFAAAAADVDSKPGPVRDAVRAQHEEWRGYLTAQLRAADADEHAGRTVFLLTALTEQANARSLLTGDDRHYGFAAAALAEILRGLGAPDSALTGLCALAPAPAS